jgi:plastocyanin
VVAFLVAVTLSAFAAACRDDGQSHLTTRSAAEEASAEPAVTVTPSAVTEPSPTMAPTEEPPALAPPEATATPEPAPVPARRPPAPTSAPAEPTATTPPQTYQPITVEVVASGQRFSPDSLTIPAHVVVTLVMRNVDAGVLHDIGVNVVGGGRTETCAGPCTGTLVFAAHLAGSYHFFCSLHPEMVGDLMVTE